MTVKELVRNTCRLDADKDYGTEEIDGTLYVYFHASWTFQDWMRNFLFWATNWRYGSKVHTGYLKEFNECVDMSLIFKILQHQKAVLIGYSRGGAMAILARAYAEDLKRKLPTITTSISTIIMGTPRAYRSLPNTSFHNTLEIVYGNDIVRKLFFWYKENPCTKYLHIESEVKGPFKACKDHGQYITCDVEVTIP